MAIWLVNLNINKDNFLIVKDENHEVNIVCNKHYGNGGR